MLDADVSRKAGWTLVDLAAACLSGGARVLQVRAKAASSGWLLDIATAICDVAHRAGAIVIINDRADIARLSGADGVHVGQDDLDPRAARVLVGESAIVGVSTHTPEQMAAALTAPISYMACGPVFQTGTKDTGYESGGLDLVRRAASVAPASILPVVAIGGITLETAPAVLEAGAASVAVISDLWTTGDPEARVRQYVQRLSRGDKV